MFNESPISSNKLSDIHHHKTNIRLIDRNIIRHSSLKNKYIVNTTPSSPKYT